MNSKLGQKKHSKLLIGQEELEQLLLGLKTQESMNFNEDKPQSSKKGWNSMFDIIKILVREHKMKEFTQRDVDKLTNSRLKNLKHEK